MRSTQGVAMAAARRADAPASPRSATRRDRAGTAPGGPPLIDSGDPAVSSGGDEPEAGALPQAEADPLVSNGLGSPSCVRSRGAGLSAASKQHCETSGFAAASAPTGDFGIDVHIDTGLLPFSSGGLLTAVQDLFVTPLWMALVWAVHALVVMLEWCFTIDLLDSGSVKLGVANGLRRMQAAFTIPWLASVLAVGAVLCAYNGLVRRRVAESLGQALVAFAMIVGGSWVMLDPAGTIGALGSWANQASLGALAVTVQGAPSAADRVLADSMGTVFAAVVEVPWCYLEFGDVGWCRNPARLDPRLHAAALAIASDELSGSCGSGVMPARCIGASGAEAAALAHSARLLRAARTNGAIFLALPANGPSRNAINDSKSLLWAICQSDIATSCRGPTAAQAEFRTNHGTWSRVGGLLLILAGALGVLLLLGFVALRLLTAAAFSLLYLLLAPAAVLAPALGEAGRVVFRRWAARLLGAVFSKLLLSLLLGAILSIVAILASFEALGWWTQWLLMSAFWWAAFAQRHQALQLATGGDRHRQPTRRHTVQRHVNDTRAARRRVFDGAQAARRRLAKAAPELGGRAAEPRLRTSGERLIEATADTVTQSRMPVPGGAGRAPRTPASPPADTLAHAAELEDRLQRIASQRARASAVGNERRAVRLAQRAERIEAERTLQRHGAARDGSSASDRSRAAAAGHETADSHAARRRQGLEGFLDAQAELPASSGEHGDVRAPRSYAALAGLAGYGRREYGRLGPSQMRAARAQIDRELALRFDSRPIAGQGVSTIATQTPNAPATARGRLRRGTRPAGPNRPQRSESELMRDAREVAARRKRQLGRGTP